MDDQQQHRQLPPRALMAAQSGRTVEAVKITREELGVSLTEAKRLVDDVTRDFASETPSTVQGREDKGALRLLAVLVLLGGVAAAVWLL